MINFGASGVVRCKHCRTYINPYVTFLNSGALWRCNCCHRDNEVHQSYFSPLNTQGLRYAAPRTCVLCCVVWCCVVLCCGVLCF